MTCAKKQEALFLTRRVQDEDREPENDCRLFNFRVILLFTSILFSILGVAQEPPKQGTSIGDSERRSFAKVFQVEKIRQLYEPRLKGAQSPDEALTKEGLTEQDYNQIFEGARADDGLRKKGKCMRAETSWQRRLQLISGICVTSSKERLDNWRHLFQCRYCQYPYF